MAENNSTKPQYINILLLGEAGVGKSTLINSFANCYIYSTFQEALNGPEVCLVPTKFSYFDNELNATLVTAGSSNPNENLEVGESGTLSCHGYVFPIGDNVYIRWIDSSGFSDTKGKAKDFENVEDILDYVVHFQQIHALAIVSKANKIRRSPPLENFLKQIIKRLGVEAMHNLIFIFTHVKSRPLCNFSFPKSSVQNVLESFGVPGEVKLSAKNTFCFENEPFRNLLESYKKLRSSAEDLERNENGWKKSIHEFKNLIHKISQLKPHDLSETFRVQKSLELLRCLSVIAGFILLNIQTNKLHIEMNKLQLEHSSETIQSSFLKMKLIPKDDAITVCVSNKQCKHSNKTIQNKNKVYGKNLCCEGCVLELGRQSCVNVEFDKARCKVCGCKLKKHEFIFYEIAENEVDIDNAQEFVNKLLNEEKVIKEKIIGLITNIEIDEKDKRKYDLSKVENSPFALSKILHLMTWKGTPNEGVSIINEELIKLPIYGTIFREALENNEKKTENLIQKREFTVTECSKTFNGIED